METINFDNASELDANRINPPAMLSHFLNWYQHEGHSNWIAEYKIKVLPTTKEACGEWYFEARLVGNNTVLTQYEAMEIVQNYELQVNPKVAEMELDRFRWHLLWTRWEELGMPEGGW